MGDHYGRHEIEAREARERELRSREQIQGSRDVYMPTRVPSIKSKIVKDTETTTMDGYVRRKDLLQMSQTISEINYRESKDLVTGECHLEVFGNDVIEKVVLFLRDESFQKMEVKEPFFLLLGRDIAGEDTIDAWIDARSLSVDEVEDIAVLKAQFRDFRNKRQRKAEVEKKIKELEAELAELKKNE